MISLDTAPQTHYAMDASAAMAILAIFVGFLPPLAAALAVIWYLIQISESRTFAKWFKQKRRAKPRR